MTRRFALSILTAALAAPAGAQFVNRAVFLGLDSEGLRRNYEQNASYFMDRDSYVRLPPWALATLDPFVPGVRYRFGSVSGREFTVEGRGRFELPLGDGDDRGESTGRGDRWRFTYDVLQSETQDTRFLRNALGFEHDLDASTALVAQGEVFAEKPQIDVSFGAHLWRGDRSGVRVLFTAVDAPNDKSDTSEYLSDPYGWMASGYFATQDRGSEVSFELAGQLPLRVREPVSGSELELHRHLGTIRARHSLGGRQWLDLQLEGEWTEKDFSAAAIGPVEAFERRGYRLATEWWTDFGGDGIAAAYGVSFLSLDAEGRQRVDPAAGYALDRREVFATARGLIPLAEHWSLEPFLQAGHVRFREAFGNASRRSEDEFRGKLSANVRYRFSDRAFLTFIVSAELHEPGFGGGGAQFVARF